MMKINRRKALRDGTATVLGLLGVPHIAKTVAAAGASQNDPLIVRDTFTNELQLMIQRRRGDQRTWYVMPLPTHWSRECLTDAK